MLGELAGHEVAGKEFALGGILTSAALAVTASADANFDSTFSQRIEAQYLSEGSAGVQFAPETADVIGSSFLSAGNGALTGVGGAYGACRTTVAGTAGTSLLGGAVAQSRTAIDGVAGWSFAAGSLPASSFAASGIGEFAGMGGAQAFGSFSSTGSALTAFLGYQNLPPADEVVQRQSENRVTQRPAESRLAVWR